MHALHWIDRFFSKGLSLLLQFMFFFVIFFLGVASVLGIYTEFFEYEENLWDISNAEIGYLLLFSLVIYRHISYCLKYKVGIWKAISRPFYALGYLMLVSLAIVGAGLIASIYSESGNTCFDLVNILSCANGMEQFFGFIVTVSAIYLATPTSEHKHIISEQSPESPEDSDTNMYTEHNNQKEKSI